MLSMTGYGRGHSFRDGYDITIELKAVNHRFLDLGFRLPKELSFLEQSLRERLNGGKLLRGHIDVSLTCQSSGSGMDFALDEQCLDRFYRAVGSLNRKYKNLRKMTVLDALNASGALTLSEVQTDTALLNEIALEALDQAVDELIAMRETEGHHLLSNLREYLDELESIRVQIAQRAPLVPEQYRARLSERLREWNLEETADPQRLAQEVALIADKCAIDEEISRLQGHILHFFQIAPTMGETGKKLDFLIQEMNREMNTMGSKANDDEIISCVVSGKCVIEKLREQIQNAV